MWRISCGTYRAFMSAPLFSMPCEKTTASVFQEMLTDDISSTWKLPAEMAILGNGSPITAVGDDGGGMLRKMRSYEKKAFWETRASCGWAQILRLWLRMTTQLGAQNDNIKGTTALGHSGGLVFFMFPLVPDGFIAAMRIDQALHHNIGPPQIPLVLLA